MTLSEKIYELLAIYKIIIISIIALFLGISLIVLTSPQDNLISIFREEVLKEIGIALIIISIAIMFYEHFLRMHMVELIQNFL